jgi:hypothetical protein
MASSKEMCFDQKEKSIIAYSFRSEMVEGFDNVLSG